MKLLFSTILFYVSLFSLNAGIADPYEIKITVDGLTNSKVIIAYRYGNSQYVKDTVETDATGSCVFKGSDTLRNGVYLAVFPSLNNNYFEFIVTESDRKFSLHTDKGSLSAGMRVQGSEENKLFFDDLKFLTQKRGLADKVKKDLEAAKTSGNKKEEERLDEELKLIDMEVKTYRKDLIANNPKLFYPKLLKAMSDVEIPESPKDANGKEIDKYFTYKYYRAHYWDNVDFSEEGLLRTPVYHDKLSTFISKTVSQEPDSLVVACDEVLKKTLVNREFFKYTLVYLLNEYAKSKIMCMEKVYVHLVDEYYAKGMTWWNDETQLIKIKKAASDKRPTLCGNVAPNQILPDTSMKRYFELHKVDADYTVIVIWDPDCGHCKKEIPVIKRVVDSLRLEGISIQVYALSTVSYEEIPKWKSYIVETNLPWIHVADPYFQGKPNFRELYDVQSTPIVLILDRDKRIIAKRIGPEQIKELVHVYEKKRKGVDPQEEKSESETKPEKKQKSDRNN